MTPYLAIFPRATAYTYQIINKRIRFMAAKLLRKENADPRYHIAVNTHIGTDSHDLRF